MFRSRGLSFPGRSGIALLAASLLICAGCGGSDPEPSPRPNEHKAEISQAQLDLRAERRKAMNRTTVNARIDRFISTLPGQAGLVVGKTGGDGPRLRGGDLKSGFAWSTIKVPIAQRVLADAGGPSRLTPDQARQITAALTLSDNEAAASLFSSLVDKYGSVTEGSEAVGEMLGEAGDSKTIISTEGRDSFSTYGQTEWSLAEQNRYLAALAGNCLGTKESTGYLLDQMSNVTSDTWGLGSIGAPARWKGGWGPGLDGKYLVRQMGVVDPPGGGQMVITLAAIPDDGSFESGQAMASEIAAWALENLSGEPEPRSPGPCRAGLTP